jgi:hypothetical protein
MTQAQDIPAWCAAFQLKLMAALDAAWAILDATDDPAEIRRARDKAKAVGDLAAMARKVAQIIPTPRPVAPATTAYAEKLARVMAPGLAAEALTATLVPGSTQADHTRRALEKLKAGRRARL